MFLEIQKNVEAEQQPEPKQILDTSLLMKFRKGVMQYSAVLTSGTDHQNLGTICLGMLGLIETVAVIAANQGIDLDRLVAKLKDIHGTPNEVTNIINEELREQGYSLPALPEKPAALDRNV